MTVWEDESLVGKVLTVGLLGTLSFLTLWGLKKALLDGCGYYHYPLPSHWRPFRQPYSCVCGVKQVK